MDDFIPKSRTLYNYFYEEQSEINDTLLYQTQKTRPSFETTFTPETQQKFSATPSLTIRTNNVLSHYYRSFQNLSINEDNNLLFNIHETTSPKICIPLSLLLVIFYKAHSHNLSGYPGREKTHATITENYYFQNINTWIAILTQDCLSWQTSKSMPNLLMAPQQPFLQISPYFNHRISMDTKVQSHRLLMENLTSMLLLTHLHIMLSSTLQPKVMPLMHSQLYLITGLLNPALQIFW